MLFKNFLMWMIMVTIFITISSNFFFIFWMMMEINLLMFIPVMNFMKTNNSNCMISYFVIQSFSSTLFLISITYHFMYNINIFELLIMISLMIKLGMIPFHFWITNLSEMFNYLLLLLILTIQKIIPLFIMTFINNKLFIMFSMISSIFGTAFLYNLKSLKKILIFSSISHLGWMTTLILLKSTFWFSYMMIYSFLIMKITNIFKKYNLNLMNNFYMLNKNNFNKISTISLMLSLGGMPPFLGFIMKFISILIILNKNSLIMMILIISSMMNIFIYIRMIYPYLFYNTMSINVYLFLKLNLKGLILNLNLMISVFFLNLLN
uniref:NADH-ubiquinone oxidoreductase chain 2 n=1 Tax=Amblyomma gervaisi TaxID=1987576 RepID=A0A977XWG9_9ACAR|nr:NADH dehydrogenase subunit 2 [Amblyomma gervaisi]UXX50146.1 NADH dehydrogenase subunit 2 [Amblyomma gervaisi]